MKIVIDASRALHPEPTGVEVYSLNIIRALLDLPEAASHEWILLCPKMPSQDHPLYKLPLYARWRIIPGIRAWTWFRLSYEFATNPEYKDAVFFVTGHILPPISPRKSVFMVHDLAYKYFPQSYKLPQRWWMDWETVRSCRKAWRIIVPSQSTSSDINLFYKITSKKITVINHGIDNDIFKPITESEYNNIPKDITNYSPYLLYIGRLEERKNIIKLIDSFELLCSNDKVTSLVLIGREGYGWEKIKQRFDRLPIEIRSRILIKGYLKNKDTLCWLKSAKAITYLSLYEGFGMPVLEAMACGIPVVCSNTSSLPEIVGSAAKRCDPTVTTEISSSIKQVLTDKELRENLIRKGISRARDFSWKKAAKETLDALTK